MPRFWSPFCLSPEATAHLVDNKVDRVDTPQHLVGGQDRIIVVPPDQQLLRFHESDVSPQEALQLLSAMYSAVVNTVQPPWQLQTERELLKSQPEPINPLTAAVLLQLLANMAELSQNLQRIDAQLQGDEFSLQRLLNSCQAPNELLNAWWTGDTCATCKKETAQMEVVLMQQHQQLQRLTQQLQSTANS